MFLLHRILNCSSGKPGRLRCYTGTMHILLVEDDHKAARLLARGLEEEGFRVTVAHSAQEVAEPDLLHCDMAILDWMMPGKDGIALCGEWRQAGHHLPILMLTARDAIGDRISGLNTGADDYLTKPYVFEELLARVRALLRRAAVSGQAGRLQAADLVLDSRSREVRRAGANLDLTPKEYAVLELLMLHPGAIVSRLQLAEHVWQADLIAIDNLIDVHMKNLRRKVDVPGQRPLIETVRGRGFRIAPAGDGDA